MRIDFDSFKEITESLARNKSRTILTGFGIFWGLFMLLFLVGGSDGLEKLIKNILSGFATNTVIIYSSTTSMPYQGLGEGRYWDIELKEVERLKMLVPEFDVVTPSISQWNQTAIKGENTYNCSVKGSLPDYAFIEEPRMKYGRYLNETDCIQERKVCVIGKHVYEALFPDGGDPCGSYIQVGSLFYQVVGLDTNPGNIDINGNASSSVVIPLTIAQKLFHRGNTVDMLAATGKKGVKMSTLEDKIRHIMAREHRFDPNDTQALGVLNTEQLFGIVDNLFTGLTILVLLIGLGTILAGAIGVSNIMMVTVKERTTEIGIRRAIGATPKQVLGQIMAESVFLTLIAGSLSIMFSVAVLQILEKIVASSDFGAVPFQIGFWTALLSALLLVGLGVVAGLPPALRAMNIKPVDAMRDE